MSWWAIAPIVVAWALLLVVLVAVGQWAEAAIHAVAGLVPESQRVKRLPGRFPGCRRYVMHCRVRNPERREDVRTQLTGRIERRLRGEGIPLPTLQPNMDNS